LGEGRAAIRRRAVWVALAVGLVLFSGADALLFRSGYYFSLVRPQSALGSVAQALANVRNAPRDKRLVIALGDSRVAEGFSAPVASQVAGEDGTDIAFVSSAVGGSYPRAWYYFLRSMAISKERVSAVVLMTPSYRDNDPLDLSGQLSDISLVHPLLRLGDAATFPASFATPHGQVQALMALLAKGYFYRNDVLDFLRDPPKRLRGVEAARLHGTAWYDAYPGHPETLAGLTLDMESGRLSVPSGLLPGQLWSIDLYARNLHDHPRPWPDNPAATRYRNEWYGKIAELCHEAGVKLIIYRIPRGPLHYLADQDDGAHGVLARLEREGLAELLPATGFDNLEHPEYFHDFLHLDSQGRAAFSAQLARAVLQRLKRTEPQRLSQAE
jgi:hypothetical protein